MGDIDDVEDGGWNWGSNVVYKLLKFFDFCVEMLFSIFYKMFVLMFIFLIF